MVGLISKIVGRIGKVVNLNVWPIFLLLLFGCGNNSIVFNGEEQSVQACNGGGISLLSVVTDLGVVHLRQVSGDADQFFLFKPNPGYVIESTYPNSVDTIIFTRGHKYVISNRSVPDATRGSVEIEIDNFGRVIADKTTCE